MLGLLLLISSAFAGDLVFQTDQPAELYLGTALVTRSWGPATVRVRGLDPGVAGLSVVRGDRTDLVDVVIPDDGAASLKVTGAGIATEPLQQPPADGPILEIRASAGQHFGVVLDHQRLAVVGSRFPIRVEGIAPGPHHLELRTRDLTVVWARADLDLAEDDLLVVTGEEGYAPMVTGRPEAFRLVGATATPGGAARGGADGAGPAGTPSPDGSAGR